MITIILAGINVVRNRGTEALAVSNVQNLQAAFPGARIIMPTLDVESAWQSFPDGEVEIVPDSSWAPPLTAPAHAKALFRGKRFVRRDVLGRRQPQEQALAEADLVVVSGGDTFSSDYNVMERYLRQLDQPIAKGIPVYFLAHSIGPFGVAAEKESFTKTARNCTFTVRETISERYLLDDIGLGRDRVTLTADPAFLMNVSDATRTRMLDEYGLEPGEYAAAACSRSISGFTGITHDTHLAAWLVAAKALIARAGRLVLVPHVQMVESRQDDLALAREIWAGLGDDPRCIVMDKALHSAVEFKAVLGQASHVVAERTHGAIGAMSSGVPTMSIGYSIKAEGVLRQLVKDDDVFAKSLIAAPDFTAEAAEAIIAASWDARDSFRDELDANLPDVKQRAALNYEIAQDLVAGRPAARSGS